MYFIYITNKVGFSKHISSIKSRITVIPMENFNGVYFKRDGKIFFSHKDMNS